MCALGSQRDLTLACRRACQSAVPCVHVCVHVCATFRVLIARFLIDHSVKAITY